MTSKLAMCWHDLPEQSSTERELAKIPYICNCWTRLRYTTKDIRKTLTCNVHVHVMANILATMTLEYHADVSFHHEFPLTNITADIFTTHLLS